MISKSTVSSFTSLKSYIAKNDPSVGKILALSKDITITEDITIPENVTLIFDKYQFINSGAKNVLINGVVNANLWQIFVNFAPGQIKGTLGGVDRMPEWWGLIPNKNEIAINSAIQAKSTSSGGHKVVLQAKTYTTSGPIDLSGTNCFLQGQGASRTNIETTSEWTADWKTDSLWGINSHGAIIWIGSAKRQSVQSMNGKIEGVAINCYYAALANPTKRISGISSYGWVEEHSIVENVTIVYFSGYGVGMGSNGNPVQVINGLLLKNFWIMQPVRADALPIACGRHTTTFKASNGTIDNGVFPGMTFDNKPWPLTNISIWAEGIRSVFEDIHIESSRFGIMVRDSGQINSVSLNAIDFRAGCEDGMEYSSDTPDIPWDVKVGANSDFFKYSTLLAVYGEPAYTPEGINSGSAYNYRSRISAHDLVGSERVRYLVRDPMMGQDILNWNNGQTSQSSGILTSYIRSNAWSPANNTWYPNVSGSSLGVYPKDKTYVTIVQ